MDFPPKGPAPDLPRPEGLREGMPTGLPGPPLNGGVGGVSGLGMDTPGCKSSYMTLKACLLGGRAFTD